MACILFLVLYHLTTFFCRLAPIRLRAPPRGGPGTGDCFGIQCTLTVCWSSLAACSASVLLPLGGIGGYEALIALPTSTANHFLSTAHAAGEGSTYPAAAEPKAGALATAGPEAGKGRRSLSRRPTAAQPGRKALGPAREYSTRRRGRLATGLRAKARQTRAPAGDQRQLYNAGCADASARRTHLEAERGARGGIDA